ncbi:GEVED domain-containing protein [Stieleria varia]|uniref:GEVED domain-containing protein n=1 Tax=Stieleria varia TaxID=2528005 RepID=A0A5C5ZXH9_9BACT|nr:GEVED domain-containing protein [Stieleria varia]TWT91959.1 hypothetical protein Pla52n_64320 [Stieleria varia]
MRKKLRIKHRLLHRRRLFSLERLEQRQLLAAGVNLALYEFTNNTAGNPEFFSTDTHLETTASDITSPLSLGWTGNGSPPNGLALGGAFNETTEPTPAGGQLDYFELTITQDAGYAMSTSRFSMQIRRNDPDSKNSYSVYFDDDPGAGGNNFTTKLTSGTITSEDTFESIIVDVEGLPEFTNKTTPLTFRVYAWGTAGLGTMRLDNIRVQAIQESVSESKLAYYGDAGRLLHPLDPRGNRIADFSTAGYRNSNEPIPDVTQLIDASRVVSVSPVPGDDMATIQAAIDQVAAMSLDGNGFRGVVQLTAGEFQISNQLRILDSGVVLRGVGDGDDPATDTILRGTGTLQRSLIVVGQSSGFASGIANTTHNIVDKYVPVGATSLLVDSTSNWSVGDPVVVRRPSTQEWISAIGMDNIPPRSDGGTVVQWSPGSAFDQLYERTITRIEGNRIFLNAPLMNSFEQQYGGGTVWRYTFPRINQIGIENIRGISDFVNPTDENHAQTFIELQAVEDAWVRNVTGQYLVFSTVHATSRSIRVTVDDAQSLDPVSIVTGGRRYPFNIDGQFILMQNLYSEDGRHDFVNNAATRNRGPNVFLNGTAVDSNSSSGPHQRWSSGTLYDTISTDNMTEARNRGNFGTGHGWAGANMVFWNNTATQFVIQNPPTAQNWLIGSTGQIVEETLFGPQPSGIYSEHGTPIDFGDPNNPLSSLFIAQLNQRSGEPGSEKREYVLGDFDLLEYDGVGSADDVFVDADWASSLATLGVSSHLDRSIDDRVVPFSFAYQLDSHEIVTAATLSLGLRGTGSGTSDDTLLIESLLDSRPLQSYGLPAQISQTETTPVLIELTGADLVALQDGLLNLAIDNNTAVDWAVLDLTVNTASEFDLGDAPSPFATLFADDGARHVDTGPRLGNLRDAEADGQPTGDADGDGGDDDGVMFGMLATDMTLAGVNVDLQNAAAAKVDAWIDFNFDGDWDDPGEQILDSVDIAGGMQTLNYSVPMDAIIGKTFARVRVSTHGGLEAVGAAIDGEVEDYLITILPPRSVQAEIDAGGNLVVRPLNGVSLDDALELSTADGNLRISDANYTVVAGDGVSQNGAEIVVPLSSITGLVGIDIDTQSGTDAVHVSGLARTLPAEITINAANANLVLSDDLTIDLEPGFSPTVGQVFSLVNAGTNAGITGSFDNVNLPTPPDNTHWDLVVGANEVSMALLSTPPRITEVRIGSTSWSEAFRDSMDPDGQGYLLSQGAEQLADVPFTNTNQIFVGFDQQVFATGGTALQPGDFQLVGSPSLGINYQIDSVNFDTGTNTAILTINQELSADKLLLHIADAAIENGNGIALDGEWSTGNMGSSGNETSGGVFNFRFDVLPGNVNNDLLSNTTDLSYVRSLGTQIAGVTPEFDPRANVNGDLLVNTTDLSLIRSLGTQLITGLIDPTPPS